MYLQNPYLVLNPTIDTGNGVIYKILKLPYKIWAYFHHFTSIFGCICYFLPLSAGEERA